MSNMTTIRMTINYTAQEDVQYSIEPGKLPCVQCAEDPILPLTVPHTKCLREADGDVEEVQLLSTSWGVRSFLNYSKVMGWIHDKLAAAPPTNIVANRSRTERRYQGGSLKTNWRVTRATTSTFMLASGMLPANC